MSQVQIVSAAWCKRCQELKPDIMRHCAAANIIPVWLDVDDIDFPVTSLPTLMFRASPEVEWLSWTAASFEAWTVAIHPPLLIKELDF